MSKKYYTLEEANKLIPFIEKELMELQELQRQFQHKLYDLNNMKKSNKHDLKTETKSIFKTESELEFMEMQAQLHLQNIQSTGAQLKNIELGILDFLSIIGDEEVLLCWKQGESKITHYHGVDEGFSGRKSLDD